MDMSLGEAEELLKEIEGGGKKDKKNLKKKGTSKGVKKSKKTKK